MTVSESLLQISNLTKQNLQLLQALNDSFYTKASHLSTQVGDVTYTIPSYIALENKVNHIQDAFNNLVHAAKAGEAWFNFDGNSKEVLVRGYQQAPNPVDLKLTSFFGVEQKFMFKDMLTPQPYLNFDLSTMPDDINTVMVKKFIPYNQELITKLNLQASRSVEVDGNATASLSWKQLQMCLDSGTVDFVEGTDYVQYETLYNLPLRQNIRCGEYVIESVMDDRIDENLENVLTLKIHEATPLVTFDQDGLSEANLKAGDTLISYDGSAKLKIRTIQPAARTIEVLVCSGEYVNPIPAGALDMPKNELMEYVSDYSKLRLYSSLTKDRNLHIPLEEDKYVFMAVAPINPRLNVRTEWGMGIFVNTNQLTKDDPNGESFRSYYNQNVQNVGDAIVEFSNIMYPSVTKFSKQEMEAMADKPVLEEKTLQVVQVNKHLNDSEAVRNIRALYSQKKQYQTDLNEIQTRIRTLNDELTSISFDDMSGTRSAITAQITDLKTQQNNLITSINKIIDAISNSANNAEIPIEDAKFRIRGYVDVDAFVNRVMSAFKPTDADKIEVGNGIRNNILGVQCRYRYKNPDIPQANVSVVDNFLFTEWCAYNPPLRERSMQCENGKYKIIYNDLDTDDLGATSFNKSRNQPKFNQLDIPISQGEVVEVQVRILWGFGHPFVNVATGWSEPLEISFPPELVKDVQVTTIIQENNNDIETNRFSNILKEEGVTDHIIDKVDDQDVTFFHRPESISSGFYTSERRIVPLKDKLLEMSNNITAIMDEIQGTYSAAIRVSFICDNVENELRPDIQNVVQLPAYNVVAELNKNIPTGAAYKKDEVVYVTGHIKIQNITQHTVRLFPIIPGPRDMFIDGPRSIQFIPYNDYLVNCWRKNDILGENLDNLNEALLQEITVQDVENAYNGVQRVQSAKLLDGPTLGGDLQKPSWGGGGIVLDPDNMMQRPDGTIVVSPNWQMTIDWNNAEGPCIIYPQGEGDDISTLQRGNQIILFCRANPFNVKTYDADDEKKWVDQTPGKNGSYAKTHKGSHRIPEIDEDGNEKKLEGLMYYPVTTSKYGLCLESDVVSAKKELAPGESMIFPIFIEYRLTVDGESVKSEDAKLCGISIRNSLYQDPLYYEFLMVAKYNQSTADQLIAAKNIQQAGTKYNIVVR